MAQAKVLLIDTKYMSEFYFTKEPAALAQFLLSEGYYDIRAAVDLPYLEGEAAAEEIFDLTNNPYRQAEREQLYGRGRSLSVGDIVKVDGELFLCCSNGWIVVDRATV